MRTALAMPDSIWQEIVAWLEETDEVAGVLTARIASDDDGTTLFARDLRRAPETSYLQRGPAGLELRSTGWVPAVRAAHDDDSIAMFVHTHPRGVAVFSEWDDAVDEKLARPFQELTGTDWYGALVVAGTPDSPEFGGRLQAVDGVHIDIDFVRVVGDQLHVIDLHSDRSTHDAFDRQVRALGRDGQNALRRLRVGVVGAGGTGSPVVEQLTRLGIGSLVLIDDDVVTTSTVARGYGSSTSDIGKPKVQVLEALAERIGLGTTVEAVTGNLRYRAVVDRLAHCDVVFSCVDGHAARLVLNRWAYAHLAPVIDVAVLVSATGGKIVGVDGRLTWLSPDAACLLCRGRIDPTIAYTEHLEPEDRRRLAAQGYVPDLDEAQPSVVTFTTLMAGVAATELLNRMFELAPSTPTEILMRLGERKISLNRRDPRVGCFCTDHAYWGRGIAEPYLDLTWPG